MINIDGNKRTGFLAMFTMLKEDNYRLTVSQEVPYDFTIKISTGEINFERTAEWLKNNTAPL